MMERLHDDEITWQLRFFSTRIIDIHVDVHSVTDGPMDWQTDGPMDCLIEML